MKQDNCHVDSKYTTIPSRHTSSPGRNRARLAVPSPPTRHRCPAADYNIHSLALSLSHCPQANMGRDGVQPGTTRSTESGTVPAARRCFGVARALRCCILTSTRLISLRGRSPRRAAPFFFSPTCTLGLAVSLCVCVCVCVYV